MQREIEALLKAYVEDSSREARLVQNVLTALAVGAAARQRMLLELQSAVGLDKVEPATIITPDAIAEPVESRSSSPNLRSVSKIDTGDVALAISQLRAARDGHVTH
jgi:hypothetical protein